MRLLVLAGGFGTRVKTAINGYPKALAPIGVIPLLHLQLENWLMQGLHQFTFLLHYQSDQIINFLKSQQNTLLKNCQVDWTIEPFPMDTGGAIANAIKVLNIKGNFLITNADTWLGGGIRELMCSSVPAMAVINSANVNRYGMVNFNDDHYITAFVEKNTQLTSGWINAGLYHLSSELFKDWDNQPFSLERNIFPKLVQNRHLTAVPLQTDFIDIGVPADYHRFCRWIAAGKKEPLCN